jgi:SOS-response transcriptional repressor LexA
MRDVKLKVEYPRQLARPEWAGKIVELRKAKGLTQAAFAKVLAVSQVAVSRWESGRDTPTAQNFLKLGHIADGPERWYFWEQGGLSPDAVTAALPELDSRLYKGPKSTVTVQPTPGALKDGGTRLKKIPDAVAVPLLRDAAAAGSPRMIQEALVEDVVVIPRRMCPHPDETVCIRVKGDSMSPMLEDSDIVAIDTSLIDRSKLYGKMVAARDPEGGVTIKWLRRSGKDELLVPQHTSLRHQPIVITTDPQWKIVGRVIWRLGVFN